MSQVGSNLNGTRLLLAAMGAALLLAAAPAHAFRCGTRIITRGDPVDKLLHYCGEPLSVQTRFTHRPYVTTPGGVFVPGLVEEVLVEEWTYNLGPQKLMRLVRLENGFVAEVKQLGYGY
jgi:hypothetical protein